MELEEAETLLEAFEALDAGLAIYGADRRLVRCNQTYRDMLGAAGEVVAPGISWEEVLQACAHRHAYADPASVEREWATLMNGAFLEAPQTLSLRRADGEVQAVSVRELGGGFLVTRRVIEEPSAGETTGADGLRAALAATAPAPLLLSDLDSGRIRFLSDAARELFGDPGLEAELFADESGHARIRDRLDAGATVGGARETMRCADGRDLPATISVRTKSIGTHRFAFWAVTGSSPAADHEALIRRVVESCPAPILMTRAKSGRIVFKSPDVDALYGPSETTTAFYERPSDRTAFLAALRRSGELREHRSRFIGADGRPFWGAVSARLIEYEGEEAIVSWSRDLTHELALEEELTRQRDQLYQHEKINALGALVAGVAHELNNPLSVVLGHAMMLADESVDPEVQRQSRKIGEAAERCAKIVRAFMGMARQTAIRAAWVDLNDVVTTAIEVIRHSEDRAGVEIDCDFTADLPQILVDSNQIAQVVINLVVNAEQAIRDSGVGDRVAIRTCRAPDRDAVILSVEDNGPGVPPGLRARIFEPFFTTRRAERGAGIGLAFSHQIVQAHEGRIDLDRELDPGARFIVELPVARSDASRAAEAPAGAAAPARILVVDDEPDVAELNAEILCRAGYRVTPAVDAAAAVELLRRDRFDAVVSDLNMPGLDGRGFFEVIVREFPELLDRTGFITGDTMGRASQSFLRETRRPYLEKPLSPGDLRDFVVRLLADGVPT